MTRMFLVTGAMMLLVAVHWGCVAKNVNVPAYGSWGEAPPPATITPADQANKADLMRENQQLRARVDYLLKENRSLGKKYADLGNDMGKVRDKTNQYATERDRYKAAAGK